MLPGQEWCSKARMALAVTPSVFLSWRLAGVVAQRFGIATIVDIALYAVVAGLLMVVFGVRGRLDKKRLKFA